jgi:hypothetical protein
VNGINPINEDGSNLFGVFLCEKPINANAVYGDMPHSYDWLSDFNHWLNHWCVSLDLHETLTKPYECLGVSDGPISRHNQHDQMLPLAKGEALPRQLWNRVW